MMMLHKITERNKKIIVGIITLITIGILLIPLISVISPLHHVDGIPMLDRIKQLNDGTISFDNYLFIKHGNSMHPIVYAIGFLDSYFFDNIPVLMELCTFLGLVSAAIVLIMVLYNKNSGLLRNIYLAILVSLLVCGGLIEQLFLPFQIGLTFTRPIFMLIIIALVEYFIKEMKGVIYVLILICACIASALHGIGLMFAGTFVYLHIMHKQTLRRILLSFIPAIFTVLLQLTYNDGFGEVNSSGGSYLIRNFIPLLKSAFAYYATPIGNLKVPQRFLVFIGMVLFIIVSFKLLYSLIVGLGLHKKIKFLPEKFRNTTYNYTLSDSFITSMLGISFLAAISSAMFAAARIDLVPSIAENPSRFTLNSTRYTCYAIMPYVYMAWVILNIKIKSKKINLLSITFLIGMLATLINYNNFMTNGVKGLNKNLDLSAVGILTGVPCDTSLTNMVWPGYQADWFWKDEVPVLFNYFQQNNEYLWGDLPRIGSHIDESRKINTIVNVTLQEYENIDYQLITASSETYPDTRYAAILDINNTVIGYVFTERKGWFYKGTDNKIYYDNDSYIKGFILSSAKASQYFRILVE